jgi:hypothetical protein
LSNNIHFYSLSPTDQKRDGQCYFDALNWALNNVKIKNIALTGPYGSGKSSILQTFQKQNTNKNFHFLNISLATFKEEKEIQNKTEGENLQRLIELSILQQLFYKEKDQKLPDSRLKKIISFSWIKLVFLSFGCVIFIISLIVLLKPNILSTIFPNILISEATKIFIHYISLICSVIGIFFIVLKSIRLLHNLKINKLNINNAEIEISPEINKSVLNHNLEEILYFFEVTNYNVVIIEDLDRFQETEIFTKLREINLLINNSRKINRYIPFIYAVRDDMFTDKDRTKFFDFIIPVIPVINASNSNEILQKEIKTIADKVSETLIDDISLFIDEMRLLYNIINEFQIYKQLLSKELLQDKLLAMIVYKNICPCDFVKLSSYEGTLYETINKKQELVKQYLTDIDEKITLYKTQIKQLEDLKIKDKKELRALYILQYIDQLNGITAFHINNQNYNFKDILEDDIFPYFIANSVFYNYYCDKPSNYNAYYLQNGKQVQLKFSDIEKIVDAEYSYEERVKKIENWNSGQTDELRKKIETLEQKRNEIRREKLQNLIVSGNLKIEATANQQKLINILLRNGYIDENYLDYISIFHEGSISKNDHTFLLNVKSQTKTDFTHRLNKIDKLISKINIRDFENEFILNYQLVDYILSNVEYERQKEAIFRFLKTESDASLEFIDGFVQSRENISVFIRELCHYWNNIWNYFYNSLFDNKLGIYFGLILTNAQTSDIKVISEKSNLKQYISEKKEFCSIVREEEKIKEILKIFDIKFIDLDVTKTSKELFDYIYQYNHYQINEKMIKIMIQAKGSFDQVDFDTRNYYAIQNSNCMELTSYINNNILEYIGNIYLKLNANTQEKEDYLIILLNNERLAEKEKTAIIQKVETKISNLEEIETDEITNILLKESKVVPTWSNLIIQFSDNEDKLSEHAVAFLNNIENANSLSKIKISTEEQDEDTVKKFLVAIVLNDNINNNSYALLLNSIPYHYTKLGFENLPQEKVNLLIEKNKLGLTATNYSALKENFSGLQIKLIEKRHWELSDKLNDLSFDNSDVIALLQSPVLSLKLKNSILEHYGDDNIVESAEILGLIGEIVKTKKSFAVSKSVQKAILTDSNKSIEFKIPFFNQKNQLFNSADITDFLNSLPEPYCNIAEKGKRPLIQNNKENEQFVNILKEKNYISKYDQEKNGLRISTFRIE